MAMRSMPQIATKSNPLRFIRFVLGRVAVGRLDGR